MDVLCLGIVTCDVLVKTLPGSVLKKDTTIAQSIKMDTGGDALNVAMNLSKMGFSSGICGKTGSDFYGSYIREAVDLAGVDTRYLKADRAEATSTSIVLISPGGERNFIFYPGATARLSLKDMNLQWIAGSKVLAIGSYFALPDFPPEEMREVLVYARKKGVVTVMDVTNNPCKSDLPALEMLLPYVDYFIPSYEEAKAVSGLDEAEEIVDFFREKGAGTVIVKLGEKGALGRNDKEHVYMPAIEVPAVDTTGAGDCFVAGMIAGILKNFSLEESMGFAVKAAGLSVTKVGATSATVSFEEIERVNDKSVTHP